MRVVLALILPVLGSCLSPPADVPFDADLRDAMPVDAMIDAAPACEADTIVCDDAEGIYVDCGPDGEAELVMNCPLGCAAGVEKCLDVVASNGLTGYLDQARDDAAVVDVEFTGTSTMNTDTGDVMIGANKVEIPTTTANGIRVFMFKALTVSGTVKITGSAPVAFIADGNVRITGTVDVSGDQAANGPGARTTGPCVGAGHTWIGSPTAGSGGGGGALAGGRGGLASNGSDTGTPGAAVLGEDLVPLAGGCRGGNASYLVNPPDPTPPPNGGGGGGALQISSRHAIEIDGGQIDASGGGGAGGGHNGSGGGAGGAILLEAQTLTFDNAAIASTKGGGGAAARTPATPTPGTDGGTSAGAAAGGAASNYASGGAGGTESIQPSPGGTGNATNNNGGGGGGSVGQARFNTSSGSVVVTNGAIIRSQYTTGTLASRIVP